ncbi:FkbM family methyltransferase [Thermodesulfobacteriota bacterium]
MKKKLTGMLSRTPIYRNFIDSRNIKKFQKLNEDEKLCIKFYQQFIKPGDLVFDVGANMGNRSKLFLALNAQVVAFEPQKICSDFLKSVLKNNVNFTLIEAALGDKEGEAEMLISKAHTVSTLSKHWVETTKKSGRFGQCEWNEKQHVHITTLDIMIQELGVPSFIKIDVEGYEFEVLSGLTHPIQFISIEFAAENIENTYKCIEYVSSLSDVSFQYSAGESLDFYLPEWVSETEIKTFLAKKTDQDKMAWGGCVH